MTPAELSRTVVRAVRSAVDAGVLSVVVPDDVKVERPRPGGGGDYASAVALKLAAGSGLAPRVVAEALRSHLTGAPGVARVDITGPGFLNFTLDAGPAAHDELVRRVLAVGPRYGHGDSLAGQHTSFAPVDEPRALAVTSVVVELLRSQGATAEITPYGSERIHVLPAHLPGVGPDAARWAYLRAAAHDRPAPAAELLAQRDSNSYFRVRYAYTRTRALTRNAHALGFTSTPGDLGLPGSAPGDTATPETATPHLHRLLTDHPDVLLRAARLAAPDRVARQLEGVADAVLDFQHGVLPLGDEKPLAAHRARLALAEAAGAVLAGGLSLFGIDAPEFL
ncbi:ArgS-related anticodon-binding protein NrtL [Streptomyces noboritoensis]|uniref:arginine--tRNA ligase n=1 Tax=Streptomyces noboritoensis TaxID=67337 RepID=A0ABV6TJZ3_9ACTN